MVSEVTRGFLITYDVLATKHPNQVWALACGEPAYTPILRNDGAGFVRCNPIYMAALTATPE
jgi:hypothetical protein